jgi:enoyl-CoA hydratase/carnithine racemase
VAAEEPTGLSSVRWRRRGAVATVTIDRPQVLNALDLTTLRQLTRCFERAAGDDRVAALVVTGAGDQAFCTGADLKEQASWAGQDERAYWRWMGAFIAMHDALRWCGKPSIARLNGMVVGGGNELNLACDLGVAAEDVTIRQIGTARGSVPAGGATQWLPLLIGDRRAREMLWLCEPVSARQALEWGLVNRVVPRSQLDEATDELARKCVAKLPSTFRYTKVQAGFWRELSWALTVPHARDWLAVHTQSAEVQAGLRSFARKQLPDYGQIRAQGTSRRCGSCGAGPLPPDHLYCGLCGKALATPGERTGMAGRPRRVQPQAGKRGEPS